MASFKKLKTGWQYRVSYKEGETYRTKSGNGYTTKREAQIAAAEIERMYNKGLDFQAGDRLFSDYYDEWVHTYKIGKVRQSTEAAYLTALSFVQDKFKNQKLKHITKTAYQKFLNDYAETRAVNSVKIMHQAVGACLREAFRNGDIPTDVTYKITISGTAPKAEKDKYLNEAEAKKLLQGLLEERDLAHPEAYIFILQLATGARIGEVVAATFESLDFENNTFNITKTWDSKYTRSLQPTKNKKVRRIAVDAQTMELIKPYYDQARRQSLAGLIKNPYKLVFLDRFMNAKSQAVLNLWLKRVCMKVGIRNISSHILRHTHASILLLHGLDLQYVAERLGDTVQVLSNTYAHLLQEMKEKGDFQATAISSSLYLPDDAKPVQNELITSV